MPDFICPVCGGSFSRAEKSLRCPAGHCFDIAKQGYVNLLLGSRSSAKRHGDDRMMVEARRAFLEKGYYRPILDGVIKAADQYLHDGADILDVGCGEGWYTEGLVDYAAAKGYRLSVCGVDISRDALKLAARRRGNLSLAVASAARLPLADGSCDILLNLFSPLEAAEYRRVLRPGGVLIRALPLERHLWSLKAAVYDTPYENPAAEETVEGFKHVSSLDVVTTAAIDSSEDIQNLFKMTPYYYKTGAADQAKLEKLDRLDAEIAVRITVST